MRLSFDDLTTPPGDVPDWFGRMVQSIKVADHLGDVWDALITWAPTPEAKDWLRTVATAEFVPFGDTGSGEYETDV